MTSVLSALSITMSHLPFSLSSSTCLKGSAFVVRARSVGRLSFKAMSAFRKPVVTSATSVAVIQNTEIPWDSALYAYFSAMELFLTCCQNQNIRVVRFAYPIPPGPSSTAIHLLSAPLANDFARLSNSFVRPVKWMLSM